MSPVGDADAYPAAAPTSALRDTPPRASLARRLAALLYEALLLVAMVLIAGFAFLPLVSPHTASTNVLTVPPRFARAIFFCALVAGIAVYYTWIWSDGRRTLPQKTWRLRLVDGTGASLTRPVALARYAAVWIGPAVALVAYAALRPAPAAGYAAALVALNYAWALVDRDRQFLHDRIAGTRVVRD